MPTSGTTTWQLTVTQLIQSALTELGAIEVGGTPDAAETTEAMRRLNGMLAQWAGEANLFREASGTLTIAAGAGSGTLPGYVRDVSSVRLIVSTTNKRPLHRLNRDEYFSLPNRLQTGTPTMFYYSHQGEADQLFVWPVPAAETTYDVDYGRMPYVATAGTETLDLPQEWQEAAIYGLAARCANMFGATRLDPNAVMRIDAQASGIYEKLLNRDRPESYYFEPEYGAYR